MKRTVVAVVLAIVIFMPTAVYVSADKGNGPRYNCTSPDGSYYQGATPGTANKLEHVGFTCVRAN